MDGADAEEPRRDPRGAPAHRRGLAVLAAVALVVLADQLTKAWAVRHLADGPVDVIGTTVQLRLTRNAGGAFSILAGFTPVLAVVAIVVAVLLVRAVRRTDDRAIVVGLALLLGGAVGNLVDRVTRAPGFLRGRVIDFVAVWRWPVFNVADACVTVGAVVIIVATVRGGRRTGRAEGSG